VSRAPHLPQKSDVAGFSAQHFAQCFASALPHFAQKLLVDGLFVPHFEQRIDAPPAIMRLTPLVSSNVGYRPQDREGAIANAERRSSGVNRPYKSTAELTF
jgi:hypothetical protein